MGTGELGLHGLTTRTETGSYPAVMSEFTTRMDGSEGGSSVLLGAGTAGADDTGAGRGDVTGLAALASSLGRCNLGLVGGLSTVGAARLRVPRGDLPDRVVQSPLRLGSAVSSCISSLSLSSRLLPMWLAGPGSASDLTTATGAVVD